MTFSYTKKGMSYFGNKRVTWGTWTNSAYGDTGGDINTGLKRVDSMFLTLNHSAATCTTSAPAVAETFPCPGNAVTIFTLTNQDGYWFAIGV